MPTLVSFSGRTPQEGQEPFYANLCDALGGGKVGLTEASTGAGKTTAILCALADIIKGTGKRGAITTPAVALVRDFAVEHARLGPNAPLLRIFLGMGEFVSEVELTMFLNNWTGFDRQAVDINNWLKAGGPSHETGLNQRYLKHTLRLIAPDIPLEEIILTSTTSDEDEGMQSYRKQFDKEADSAEAEEILLCSHAMLAVDVRTRLAVAARSGELDEKRSNSNSAWKLVKEKKSNKADSEETGSAIEKARLAQTELDQGIMEASAGLGKLPDFSYLVVDEAHLLEQSFSNALSNYVAIHQFVLHARELSKNGLLTKASLAQIEHAYQELCSSVRLEKADTIHLSQLNGKVTSPLHALAFAAKDGIKKISAKRMATIPAESLNRLKEFRSNYSCIEQASQSISGQVAYINLSPRLAYPRLFVGRSTVEQYLRYLWASVNGAAMVSATLYIPKEDAMSSWYMSLVLAIPLDRKQDYEPVIPTWIRDTIQEIRMPTCSRENGRIKLRPTSKGDKLDDVQKEQSDLVWCKEVADELVNIYETAAGGCLVLMTSYSYVNKVKTFLLQHPEIAQNLIFAQQGEIQTKDKAKTQPITIDEQRRKYLQLALSGGKPIWLALGNAWTGINLSGGDPMHECCGVEIPAHKDNVLTDLVIPRLPFGVNKSVTHIYRIVHKQKVQWERIDTLLRLRQGVGRLVRRKGTPRNRRIHILDARLCEGTLASLWNTVFKAVGGKS